MMKTLYLSICFITIQTIAYGQNLVWAKHLSGTSTCEILSSSLAPNGDLLSTGIFTGTFDFDPGSGVSELTAEGNTNQFVLRTDANGSFLWAMPFGNASSFSNVKIVADEQNNFYVAGTFSEPFDLDPSSGENILTANGSNSVFVAKYSPERELIWVNKVDNSGYVELRSLLVSESEGAFVAGTFKTSLSINDNEDVSDLGNNTRGFLVKFDAQGAFDWSGYLSDNATINDLAFNNAGQVITVGRFFGSCDADFDEDVEFPLIANASFDVFVTIYAPDRTLVDALKFGASGFDEAHAVTVDGEGNIIVAGSYTIQINPDPAGLGPSQLTTSGGRDGCFIAKYDADLGFIWAEQLGRASDTFIFDVATDAENHVYTSGTFSGGANMDPASPETNEIITAVGDTDGFLSHLDADGNYVSGGQFSGDFYSEKPRSIVFDGNGAFYVTGSFTGNMDVDAGDGVVELISAGASDSFIAKYNGFPLSNSNIVADSDAKLFPNPSNGAFTFSSTKDLNLANVQIFNISGQSVPFELQRGGNQMDIDIDAPTGLYQVFINYPDETIVNRKIVVTNR